MWKEAEEFLAQDKYISPLVEKYGHCALKPLPKKYYCEDLVDAIIQQQLSMSAATAIFNRVKLSIADRKDSKISDKHKWRSNKTLKVKITPKKILMLSDKNFRDCGLSRAKIIYIRDLAGKVIANKLLIKKLDKLMDDEVIEKLTAVKGIGIWTAHMFLMFSLARQDIFPVGDLGLRNAFKKVVGKNLDNNKMEKFSYRWKPYRTIAAWYI